jgi:hypothetical protein
MSQQLKRVANLYFAADIGLTQTKPFLPLVAALQTSTPIRQYYCIDDYRKQWWNIQLLNQRIIILLLFPTYHWGGTILHTSLTFK